jgi:hypothetical protein
MSNRAFYTACSILALTCGVSATIGFTGIYHNQQLVRGIEEFLSTDPSGVQCSVILSQVMQRLHENTPLEFFIGISFVCLLGIIAMQRRRVSSATIVHS